MTRTPKDEFDKPSTGISPSLLLELNAFISEKDVLKLTSLSRTSLHRKRVAGAFPEPEQISDGRVGYRIRDVQAWLSDPARWATRQDRLDI